MQASNNNDNKRPLENTQNVCVQKKSMQGEKQFSFKEWSGLSYYGLISTVLLNAKNIVSNKLSSQLHSEHESSKLSHFNVQQMKQEMSSIKNSLYGNSLRLRLDIIDPALLKIDNPDVRDYVASLMLYRIVMSSCENESCQTITLKQLISGANHNMLKFLDINSQIEKEVHALEITKFVKDEIAAINNDKCVRISGNENNLLVCSFDQTLKNYGCIIRKEGCNEIFTLIDHYVSTEPTLPALPAVNQKTRKIFNDIHMLERSIICDDFTTQASLQLQYQNIQKQYRELEPQLSQRVKYWLAPSFQSLEQSIENFQEN